MPDLPKDFLREDGLLKIVQWARAPYGPPVVDATDGQMGLHQVLHVSFDRPLPMAMAHSHATGRGLVSNGEVGVDMIRVAAGQAFQPHTHPGHHLLIVIAGRGTITYGGTIYPTRAGQVYLIEGQTPHAVGAIDDHVILAVGSPHKPVDAPDRMAPVEYRAVYSEIGELHCLICRKVGNPESPLCEQGCPHCVCNRCNDWPE